MLALLLLHASIPRFIPIAPATTRVLLVKWQADALASDDVDTARYAQCMLRRARSCRNLAVVYDAEVTAIAQFSPDSLALVHLQTSHADTINSGTLLLKILAGSRPNIVCASSLHERWLVACKYYDLHVV